MSIKTLTEILGLSLELKDYEDRLQKRYDYIQEQLEKDPEFVAYDYLEYWHGRADIHYLFKEIIISSKGDYYQEKNGVWSEAERFKTKAYLEKGFRLVGHGPKNFPNTQSSWISLYS